MNVQYAKEVIEYSEKVMKQRQLMENEQDEYEQALKVVGKSK